MEQVLQTSLSSSNIMQKIVKDADICYVVLKNTTVINNVTSFPQKDEITQVLKVFAEEDKAKAFKKKIHCKENEAVYVIPTLYEGCHPGD